MEKNIYTQEEEYWRLGGNTGTLPNRITPSQINVLEEGEIFVFGSNFQGEHIGGAARVAKEKFGAVWGIGEGLQGHSYAIPTMEGLDNLAPAVERFALFAHQHKELKFYVTAVGCGIAGYQPEQVAPMFLKAAYLRNVYLPVSFWKIILNVAYPAEKVRSLAESVIEVCRFVHKHNVPVWKESIDEAIFNGMERDQHWQLGILLGVISPIDKEPNCKALPAELRDKILQALKNA